MAVLASYLPERDDLCLYDGSNTGIPIGWNPDNPLYPYRAQLGAIKLPYREFFNQSISYPEPPATPLSQKPNYWNSHKPHFVFVAPRLGLCSMHYWEGVFDRNRNAATYGIWDEQSMWFADASFNTTRLTNTNFLRPWTRTTGGVQVSPTDVGICEYDGPSVSPYGTMPVLVASTIPRGTAGFCIDGNGKTFEFTMRECQDSTPPGYKSTRGTAPNLLEIFQNDSSTLWLVPIDGILHLVGQQFFPSGGPLFGGAAAQATLALPTSYLDGLGSGKQFVPVRYPAAFENLANQTDTLDAKAQAEAILALVS